MDDPYEVLGIPRSATLGQAEAAYRERLRAAHPDHQTADADEGQLRASAAKTQALNEAIKALRYELREVRLVDRCASCGTPGVDLDRPCPVCGDDPGSVPWWREAGGESAPGALPPGVGSVSSDWMTTPRVGNAAGPAVVALLALAAFAAAFWLLTQLVAGS